MSNNTIIVGGIIVIIAIILVIALPHQQKSSKSTSTTQASSSSSTTTINQTANFKILSYNQTVPQKYLSLYQALQADLNVMNQTITQNTPILTPHLVTYGGELLDADGNVGSKLFTNPNSMTGVISELNAYQKMGINGVTVAIRYPMLLPSFPNSSEYLAFYENVSQQIHKRGMIMDVECAPAIPGYGLNYSFAGLNYSTLISGERQMVQIISNSIHPDYINIDAEPATAAEVTGIHSLDTAAVWGNYTAEIFTNLSKGNSKVGIGVDTWESSDFLKVALNASSVDFISTHVYPIGQPIPQNLITITNLARQHNKPLIVDEIGPWESTNVTEPAGNVNKGYEQISTYAFWIPINNQFLNVMSAYSKNYNVQFISAFPDARMFFAYLNYNSSTANLTYGQTIQAINQKVGTSLKNSYITPTGAAYAGIIKSS